MTAAAQSSPSCVALSAPPATPLLTVATGRLNSAEEEEVDINILFSSSRLDIKC